MGLCFYLEDVCVISRPQDLLPAYEAFHEEYSTANFSINRSKYVRYSPDNVRAFIQNDLFEGETNIIILLGAFFSLRLILKSLSGRRMELGKLNKHKGESITSSLGGIGPGPVASGSLRRRV